MYKDKDKQREADKLRQQRRRDKIKTKGVTEQGVTQNVIPQTKVLPACVPEPVRSRYAKGEPEYMQTIDRLLSHTIDQLKAEAVWIPVWRYTAGQAKAVLNNWAECTGSIPAQDGRAGGTLKLPHVPSNGLTQGKGR